MYVGLGIGGIHKKIKIDGINKLKENQYANIETRNG